MYFYSYFLSLEIIPKASLFLCLLSVIYLLVSQSFSRFLLIYSKFFMCLPFASLQLLRKFLWKTTYWAAGSTSWGQTWIYRLGKLCLQTVHTLRGMQAQLLLPLPQPTQGYSQSSWVLQFWFSFSLQQDTHSKLMGTRTQQRFFLRVMMLPIKRKGTCKGIRTESRWF